MKVLALLLAFVLAASAALAAPREAFDYFLVLDTSGSMAGRPAGSGNANIMPRLKEAVREFLDKVALGSRVAIQPFDVRVHDAKWVTLATEEDREALKRFVEGLDPRGARTCIYSALTQTLQWIKTLRSKFPDVRHIATILLYTDGLNECDDSTTLQDVLSRYKLSRAENDFLFYTTLGVELPPVDRALLSSTPGVRYTAEPRGRLEPLTLVEVRPAALDFGDLGSAAEATRTLALSVNGQLPEGATASVECEVAGLTDQEAVQVKPAQIPLGGQEAAITLKLLNPQSFRQQAFTGELKLQVSGDRIHVTPVVLPLAFSTLPPRTWDVASPSGLPVSLGELGFGSAGRASAKVKLLFQPSASARSSGSKLVAEVVFDPSNPAPMEPGKQAVLESGGARGARVEIGPEAGEAELVFAVAREGTAAGTYSGGVVLTAQEADLRGPGLKAAAGTERVKIVGFSFTVPGDRVVTVSAAGGAATPLELGSAVLERIGEKDAAVLEKPLLVSFSPEAVSKGARVRADLELQQGNPAPLEAGKDVLLVGGAASGPSVALEPASSKLLVRALVPRSAKPGTYRGKVVLWPEGATLAGAGLSPDARSAGARTLDFAFTAEAERRLTVTSPGAGELGDLHRGGPRLERKYKLAWSETATRGGAGAQASLRLEPPLEVATLKCGLQSGAQIRLSPGQDEMTLTVEVSPSAKSGSYAAHLEVRGEGCTVVGSGFTSAEGAVVERIGLRVPRPLWLDLTVVALVVGLLGAWGYQASLPRFSAYARLSVDGPGGPSAYYLRGHQGRFSRDVSVGGPGVSDLAVSGLAGRAFSIRPEGGSRYVVVPSVPISLKNPDTGVEEVLSPARPAVLPDGAVLEVGDVRIQFSERV